MSVDMRDSLLGITSKPTFLVFLFCLFFLSSDDDFEEIEFGSGSDPEVKIFN